MAEANERPDDFTTMDTDLNEEAVNSLASILGETQKPKVEVTDTIVTPVTPKTDPVEEQDEEEEEVKIDIKLPEIGLGNNTDSNTEDDDESPYSILVNMFKGDLIEDVDIENENFKFDGSKNSFAKVFVNASERKAEGILDDLIKEMPTKLRTQVTSFLEGLEEDQAISFGDTLSKLESLTDEVLSEDTQKAEEVYRELLQSKGFAKDKIEKYITRAKELDELTDEAKDAREALKADIKAKAEKEKQEAISKREREADAAKQRVEDIKKDINSRKELIEGLPTTDTLKKKVLENILNPVAKDSSGNVVNKVQALFGKNPTETAILLNTYIELGLFNFDDKSGKYKPDLSKIVSYKKSDVVDDVTSKLKHSTTKLKTGRTSMDSTSNIGTTGADILKTLSAAFKQNED